MIIEGKVNIKIAHNSRHNTYTGVMTFSNNEFFNIKTKLGEDYDFNINQIQQITNPIIQFEEYDAIKSSMNGEVLVNIENTDKCFTFTGEMSFFNNGLFRIETVSHEDYLFVNSQIQRLKKTVIKKDGEGDDDSLFD